MMSFQKIYSPMQLANAMKLVRQQNGWTQSELAKKIGIKQATISNFENNPDNTSLTVVDWRNRWPCKKLLRIYSGWRQLSAHTIL